MSGCTGDVVHCGGLLALRQILGRGFVCDLLLRPGKKKRMGWERVRSDYRDFPLRC